VEVLRVGSARWYAVFGVISVSDSLGRGIGRAIARRIVEARLRRLVREASGYLNEGEKLVAPVGGRFPWRPGFPAVGAGRLGGSVALFEDEMCLAGGLVRTGG
jgi:hypothetical protein